MLTNFLFKVRQLRGYGDMDSYRLVNDFKKLHDGVDEVQVNRIIHEFSSHETYDLGKQHFIQGINSLMDEVLQDKDQLTN